MQVVVEEAERQGTYVAAHAHGGPGLRLAAEAGVRTIEHAAVATLATELARTVLALRYSRQLGLAMTPITRFARIAVASSVMGVCVWLVADRPVYVSIPIGGIGYVGGFGGIRHRD